MKVAEANYMPLEIESFTFAFPDGKRQTLVPMMFRLHRVDRTCLILAAFSVFFVAVEKEF